MPLQTLPTSDSYIKRTRIYLSNEEQSTVVDEAHLFDYGITLKDEIQNVIGCELVGFSMAKHLTPTFRGRYVLGSVLPYASNTNTRRTSPPGNCMLDIHLNDTANVLSLTFVVDFELIIPTAPTLPYSLAGRIMTIAEIGNEMQQAIRLAMNATGDAYFNTTFVTLTAGVDSNGCFYCKAFEIASPANLIEITLLFGTGTNKSDSPSRVLGFPDNVDTTLDPTTFGVQGTFAVDPVPIRYVDLNITQIPEFRPFARVFLNPGDFSRPLDRPTEFRLLTDPIGHLTRLDMILQFNNDQRHSASADLFHDIALDVISLEPVSKKPNWVNQRFLI